MKAYIDQDLSTGCQDDPLCLFIQSHITEQLTLNVVGSVTPKAYILAGNIPHSTKFGDQWIMSDLRLTIEGRSEIKSLITVNGQIKHVKTGYVGKSKHRYYISLECKTYIELILYFSWAMCGYRWI